MQNNFDSLVNSFLLSNVGLTTDFLSTELSTHLKENLLNLFSENQLKPAGIGNNLKLTKDNLVRSDVIYWLDRNHNDEFENAFFDIMDEFVSYLNHSCYTGIVGYEFHYALYGKGTFYKRHLDQFNDNNSRAWNFRNMD